MNQVFSKKIFFFFINQFYQKVCGDGITYSSECVAKCAKAKTITKGKCNCEKDKAYMKCLKSNIDISQHPFSKLTDQEKKQVYMIYHFNSSKSFDELENQYKFVKETLPHLFNDDK